MMTDREILDLKIQTLLDGLTDDVLVQHADLAGALIYRPTGKPLTALQLRRRPPPELVEHLRRRFAGQLESLSVAIVAGKTIVRQRINPEDLQRRRAPTLNFPDP
jgi:hypothetical protein